MEIRRLSADDAQALWDLRKLAVSLEPDAFGESLAEHLATPVETFANRLKVGGEESFVLGAVVDGALVGMVGFYRETRLKRRHRGWIWGMFVAQECRGARIGSQLLGEALNRARRLEGLKSVLLGVAHTQESARRLYARAGFVPFGYEREALQVDGRFIDEEHMMVRF